MMSPPRPCSAHIPTPRLPPARTSLQVVFGIVLMGYRELMEGHHSGLVTFTVAMVGIEPNEVRVRADERRGVRARGRARGGCGEVEPHA